MITRYIYKSEFKSANNHHLLPEDYLHFLSAHSNIAIADIIFAFIEILSPELIVYKDKVFIKDRFNFDKLKDYDTINQAQYWINLIYISELYQDIDNYSSILIANLIINNWQALIQKNDFGDFGIAKIIQDNELAVFVTIYCDG